MPSGTDSLQPVVKKGRIQQSVCGWCYKSLSLDTLASVSAKLGLAGIDLVKPADFPTLKKKKRYRDVRSVAAC